MQLGALDLFVAFKVWFTAEAAAPWSTWDGHPPRPFHVLCARNFDCSTLTLALGGSWGAVCRAATGAMLSVLPASSLPAVRLVWRDQAYTGAFAAIGRIMPRRLAA